MVKYGEWKKTLERFAREGLLPPGQPDKRYYNDNRVNRQRSQAPRVRGRHDPRDDDDRADHRDEQNEPDSEDDR